MPYILTTGIPTAPEDPGRSVKAIAISGDGNTIAIGYYYFGTPDTGQVYVYTNSSGAWVLRDTITPVGSTATWFGRNVALNYDGTILVCGAPYTNADTGAVEVYSYSGAIWLHRDTVSTVSPVTGEQFGYSVGLSDDGLVLAVGSRLNSDIVTDGGSVHVFDYVSSSWVQRTEIIRQDTPTALDHFGYDVAISGDGLVVAGGFTNRGDERGEAHIFKWSAITSTWELRGVLIGEGATDWFSEGLALNFDGSMLVVTAPQEDTNGTDYGLGYSYGWDGTQYKEESRFTGITGIGDKFGYSCSITSDGDTLVVGSWGNNFIYDNTSIFTFFPVLTGLTLENSGSSVGLSAFGSEGLTSPLVGEQSLCSTLFDIAEIEQSADDIDSSSSFAITAFDWSSFYNKNKDRIVKRYFFTITGGEDGTTDIEIPITSFQSRRRGSDSSTFLSVVIRGSDYNDEINARPNGQMIIDMDLQVGGISRFKLPIITVDMDAIRTDTGGRSISTTLEGHRTAGTLVGQEISLSKIQLLSVADDGSINLRSEIDMFARPGDTINYPGGKIVATEMAYFVSPSLENMTIKG